MGNDLYRQASKISIEMEGGRCAAACRGDGNMEALNVLISEDLPYLNRHPMDYVVVDWPVVNRVRNAAMMLRRL